ncbi:MAG: dynamin family protein [Verrucomicrobiae bacterium]|nr:dynamin family protein [Verrucomicrobiae bacterium]
MNESVSSLDHISGVAAELRLGALIPQISACRELLQRNDGIDVAVFGRFKAGKSSFLNHLTGRAVLPLGVVPLTAVITRLRFGEREHAEVRFLDGTKREISLAEIGQYVGENENPNNAKRVAAVEVDLPELKPLAPLQFVDTPGLGSAFAHNTEVALNWLPQVGAALVAMSSDAPLSERDLALLEDLRRHTPKIVLLLTKADLLTKPQRMEVRDFVKTQLRRSGGRESAQSDQSVHPGVAAQNSQSRLTSAATRNGEIPVFYYSIKPELEAMSPA